MYRDADNNAIPGFADFTEIVGNGIATADYCCSKACSAEEYYFLLPACPDRQTATGAITYSIETNNCESTQTDTITYHYSDGTEVC